MLLARDRYVCAYCTQRFQPDELDMEHIILSSKGGAASWMNLVAACKACNRHKGNRTPEGAGLKLHYVPYTPNRHEAFILRNRRILPQVVISCQLRMPVASPPRGECLATEAPQQLSS